MKKNLKKMLCLVTVLCLSVMTVPNLSIKTEAAETDKETEANAVSARIVIPEEEVFATVTRAAADGWVVGSGVRLRKKPSSSSTVLELMYDGEYVSIFYYDSTPKWYAVERIKTGTYGYVSKDYILPF